MINSWQIPKAFIEEKDARERRIKQIKRDATRLNKKAYIEQFSKIAGYTTDPDREDRNQKGLCRLCYYIYPDRIGGSAVTTRPCFNCGENQMYGSTSTDPLCLGCSKKTKMCKRCMQKMD